MSNTCASVHFLHPSFAVEIEKDKKRQAEFSNQSSVMEDLISNSSMLPDLMLSLSVLETELDITRDENEVATIAMDCPNWSIMAIDDFRN